MSQFTIKTKSEGRRPGTSTRPRPRLGRALLKFVLWSLLLVVVMSLCIILAMGALGSGIRPAQVAKSLDDALPYASLIHIVLIALLWWKWAAFVERCFRTGRMTPAMREVALASRTRTILLLTCFELVVVLEFPFSLIRLWQHG